MSCRDGCRYAQYCRRKGSDIDPEMCATAYKIEDLLWDAECSKGDYQDKREEVDEDAQGEG